MKFFFSILLIFVLTRMVQAQETQAPQGDESQTSAAPPMLVGQSPRRRSVAEQSGPSYLTGGVNITQIYTDNADLTANGGIHDLSYSIGPHLAFTHSTPRLSYSAGIFAGFVVNRTLSDRNLADQTASLDVSYGISQFTTVRLSESFSNTTGLWSGSEAGSSLEPSTGIGAVQEPNPSVLTFGRYHTNTALGELSHQFSLHTIGGVRGTHTYTWFPNAATSPVVGTLYGGQSYSAEVFYDRRFNARHWVGVTLRGQRFDLDRSVGRTDTLSAIFLYGLAIRPNLSLSFFAGPELSMTAIPQGISAPVLPFPRRMWSPTTGATFSYLRPRTGVTASFVRGITNGAGLVSAVTISTVEGTVTRRLSRSWEGGANLGYTNNEPLVPSQTFRTYSTGLELISHITNNVAVSGGCGRDENMALDTGARASANRVWISLSWSFLRPLGR
jgi:hypothetical protein